MKWFATVWDDRVEKVLESHGPYDTADAAKQVATKLHNKRGVFTAFEARYANGKAVSGKGDYWPHIKSNEYNGVG